MNQLISIEDVLSVGSMFTFPEENINGNQKPISGIYNENGCLICNSHSSTPNGYCYIHRNGKRGYVHRLVFSKWCKEIPEGYVVMHKCDEPSCCNPDHLKLGTPQDNIADKIAKGRQPMGSDCANSKLTEEDVYYILSARNETNRELAKKLGVSATTIRRVKNSLTWKHITLESEWRNHVA